MKSLFEMSQIGPLVLRNRLVRSATWEGMANADGTPGPRLVALVQELAEGGIALINTGYISVSADGMQMPGQMRMDNDACIAGARELVEAAHRSGALICAQLVHCGGQSDRRATGVQPMAPSPIEWPGYSEQPAQMQVADIQRIGNDFVQAARRCAEAGFDAIQLHAAHAYLFSQFLSPALNQRTDEYGSTPGNRARFLLETVGAIRDALGDDFPLLVKLNGEDHVEAGLDAEQSAQIAQMLELAGITAIEVSGGTPASGHETPVRKDVSAGYDESYNLDSAQRIARAVDIPLISVGGYRSYSEALRALRSVDFVALSRPLIRESALPRRWAAGELEPSSCVSCNGCFRPGIKEGGIRCVLD